MKIVPITTQASGGTRGGLSLFVTPNAKRTRAESKNPKCSCGYRRRGKGHDSGPHHRGIRSGKES